MIFEDSASIYVNVTASMRYMIC